MSLLQEIEQHGLADCEFNRNLSANNSLIIAYHAKHEHKGWYEVCRYPVDSDQWSKQDRVFIDELLEIGDMVLTCGWNMWQVVKPV